MTSVVKSVLALAALCVMLLAGTSAAHHVRADKHYYRLLYAARNAKPEQVVSEYRCLPRSFRERPFVKEYYEEARTIVGDSVWHSLVLFPTLEKFDVYALFVFAAGLFLLFLWVTPRKLKFQRRHSKDKTPSAQDEPSEGQLAFIRRINNGIIPVGLTKTSAATMIKEYISTVGMASKRQRIDVSPTEFLTGSKSHRERMKLERERKRAQEKLARQQEMAKRQQEREALREKKLADRLYDKRLAEEERLIKAREEEHSGLERKARSAKARTIQEFQSLVNRILADKQIDPQEARQLKAWLMANRQSESDFEQMFKLIDESLVDGIIDADETQAIYEGVIDCLITLRERK